GHTPTIRNGGSLAMAPDGEKFILFGGDPLESFSTPVVTTLAETPTTPWQKVLPVAEGPPSRPSLVSFASAVVTEVGGTDGQQQGLYSIVFGGVGGDRASIGETYAFDLNRRLWRRLFFPHGGPPPRHSSGLCISHNTEVLLFGGI
ncbi:hypothetical protein FOZ62_016501, partial [Perkinsus olseni]